MKKIPLSAVLTILMVFPQMVFAGWWRTYGTEGAEAAFSVRLTKDAGYVVSGHSDPLGGCRIVKTDYQGEVQWSKTFAEEFLLGGLCIQQVQDGGYIVTVGERLIRADEEGDSLWTRSMTPSWSEVEWVIQTGDGGYVATGWVNEYHAGDLRSLLTLARLDSEGNLKWNYGYGGELEGQRDGGTCVRQTSDGGYVMCGWRDDGASLWLIKTDTTANTTWKVYDTTLWMANCVRQCFDGGYIVSSGATLVKFDSWGTEQWRQPLGSGADAAISLVQASDGGYVVAGAKYPAGVDIWERSDLWLVKTDSLGNCIWSRTYGGAKHDAAYCIEQSGDGGYIVAGSTSSFGAGDRDYYLLKTDSEGFLVASEESFPSSFKVITSIGPRIVLSYSNIAGGFHAAVFDALGRKVDEIDAAEPSGTITWGKGIPQGIYFIHGMSRGGASTQKVVLID